jgi:hypothetical protein
MKKNIRDRAWNFVWVAVLLQSSDFNPDWKGQRFFFQNLKYEISWKSFQGDGTAARHADRQVRQG